MGLRCTKLSLRPLYANIATIAKVGDSESRKQKLGPVLCNKFISDTDSGSECAQQIYRWLQAEQLTHLRERRSFRGT